MQVIPISDPPTMKPDKIRHQLFLPKALSDRIGRIADGTGRPRSEILVEASGGVSEPA